MFVIRPATVADAPSLPAVERSSGEAFRVLPDLAWIADDAVQSVARHLALIAHDSAWVAAGTDEIPVGFLNGETAEDVFHILQLAVRHELQGRGIGSALIAEVVAVARRRGLAAITLTTFRAVPWNEPYYRRRGFRTLAPEDLSPRLRALLAREAQAGLPADRRCAMQMDLHLSV